MPGVLRRRRHTNWWVIWTEADVFTSPSKGKREFSATLERYEGANGLVTLDPPGAAGSSGLHSRCEGDTVALPFHQALGFNRTSKGTHHGYVSRWT